MSSSFPSFKSFNNAKKLPCTHGQHDPNRRKKNDQKDLKTSKVVVLESPDFKVDCRGDFDTLKYESLDKGDIPKYRRFQGGLVLGLGKHVRIITRKNGKTELVERFPYKNKREALAKSHAQKDIIHLKNIRRIDRILEAYDGSFISLGLDWNEIESWDRQRGTYAKDFKWFDSESQYLEEQRKFNELLDKNPMDENLWCRFADFQMSRVRGSGFKASLEKQASVLERAMDRLPSSETIAVRYLKCIGQLWENTRILREWDRTISKYRHSFYIWDCYLAFRLSNFSTFSYSSVQEIFERFSYAVSNNPDHRFQVFQRACEFHKSCGYYEKSVAMYQALIEFNFFCPDPLKVQPVSIKLQFFEDYWCSDCPKLGSKDYVSWEKYYKDRKDYSIKSTKRSPGFQEELINPEENVVECWAKVEIQRELHDWFPMLTNEEVEDPDRIVIFEDIRAFVFDLPEERLSLTIRCMISFFGVPVLEGSQLPIILGRGPGVPTYIDLLEKEKMRFFLQDFPVTTQSPTLSSFNAPSNPFRRGFWGYSGSIIHSIGENRLGFLARFICQVCNRFESSQKDIDFFRALYTCLSPGADNGTLEKRLKMALAERESPILWGLYADVVRGKTPIDVDEVRKIHFQLLHQLFDLEILISWLEWELSIIPGTETKDWSFCFNLLIRFAHGLEDKSTWSQISIVKARKFYEDRSAPLLTYFEFLYADSLLDFLESFRGNVNSLSPEFLNCLSLSISRFPLEVSLAVSAIEGLPDHPVVWALRLHQKRFMSSTKYALSSDSNLSPSQWLSRIWFEYLRHEDIDGVKHRIKRMFEQSVQDNPSSFILWDAYMRWTCMVDPLNAKTLHIRAINSVPYSKDLYLSLIVRSSERGKEKGKRHIVTEKDLVETLNIMEEKEIRLRTLFEEVDCTIRA